jgi:YbbR domain-containing protein
MGLVEKTDALAMVVSEERGKISIFDRGKFRLVDNPEKLEGIIISHWKHTASYPLVLPKGKTRRRIFFQMFASLALAFLFWSALIVAQGEGLEKVITVPVEYTTPPATLVLVGDKAKEIRIHLAGSKSDLASVNPAQMSAKIDLSKALAGKQTFVITKENMRLPRGVQLLDVVPASIELTLAEIVEQEVTIKPQLVGKLPGSLKIRSIEVRPEKVKVLSPASEGKAKSVSVLTTPIYLESIYDDITLYCKIIAPPAVQPVEKRWPDIEVMITLKK